MHEIVSGILKALKECALERICDQSLLTGEISVTCIQKPFPYVRLRAVLFLNNFLKRLDTDPIAFKFKDAFNKAGTSE